MNAIEYLESKGVFMLPDKRRYKIIKRNGHEVYVLTHEKISRQIIRLRIKKMFARGVRVGSFALVYLKQPETLKNETNRI